MLTPHAGELARLIEVDADWVDAHRLEAAGRCAEQFGAVVVLKGADTIVRAPDGRTIVCDTGPPSLATAGTGDVLTGVVGAFLAKGLDPVDAAAAAAVAHGLAAQAVPRQAGAGGLRRHRGTPLRASPDRSREWGRDPLARDDRPRRGQAQRAGARRQARRDRALGGRQGGRLRPRCGRCRPGRRSKRERRRSASRPSPKASRYEPPFPRRGSSSSALTADEVALPAMPSSS